MRAVVQRVTHAKVTVNNEVTGKIDKGFVILLGVGNEDDLSDIDYLSKKVVNLRVFEDEEGKMNHSLLNIEGEILVISQFTLYGDVRKGRRPNFMASAPPEKAETLYEAFNDKCAQYGLKIANGVFGEHMDVHLVNDGPVTILLDSKKVF